MLPFLFTYLECNVLGFQHALLLFETRGGRLGRKAPVCLCLPTWCFISTGSAERGELGTPAVLFLSASSHCTATAAILS